MNAQMPDIFNLDLGDTAGDDFTSLVAAQNQQLNPSGQGWGSIVGTDLSSAGSAGAIAPNALANPTPPLTSAATLPAGLSTPATPGLGSSTTGVAAAPATTINPGSTSGSPSLASGSTGLTMEQIQAAHGGSVPASGLQAQAGYNKNTSITPATLPSSLGTTTPAVAATPAVAPVTAAAASPATTPATTPVTAPAATTPAATLTGLQRAQQVQGYDLMTPQRQQGLVDSYNRDNAATAAANAAYAATQTPESLHQVDLTNQGNEWLGNYTPMMTMDAFMAARGQPNYDEPWLNSGWGTPSVLPGGRSTGAPATPTNAIAPGGRAVDAATLASDQANSGSYLNYSGSWRQQRRTAFDEYMNSIGGSGSAWDRSLSY